MSTLDVSHYRVGQEVAGVASLREGKTKPPRPFEEGDLISIMDDIGRYANIGKDDMAILRQRNAAGSGKAGIGTSRTRSEIIKKAFDTKFLEKYKSGKKQYVRPTAKAISMYDILLPMPIGGVLVSPEMTAKWEVGLQKIESGEITLQQFMSKIRPMVSQMTLEIAANPSVKAPPQREKIEDHPRHGETCEKCKKGGLVTRLTTKPESKYFGKRYVKCPECDYFGDFID